MTNNALDICIVEDSDDYRIALQEMINATPGFVCTHTYANGESALKKISGQSPDIVLVDIGLPGISGLELIKSLKSKIPKIQFMVLTVSEEGDKIFSALKVGASGYLLKSTPPKKIIEAIQDLANGGAPMSRKIARLVVASFQGPQTVQANPYDKILTKREKDVLKELSEGLLYKNIAAKLNISIETVKTHCHNIYTKLQATTRTEAINNYKNGHKNP